MIGGVALLEEVYHRELILRFQKLKPRPVVPSSFLLLPEDSDIELSAPLQHHVFVHSAMLSAIDNNELNLWVVN